MRNIIMYIAILMLLMLTLTLTGCGRYSQEFAPELVGTWHWNDDPDWTYVFRADGTGERGFHGFIEQFTWNTSGNEVVIRCQGNEPVFGMPIDRWYFEITGYSLRLLSRHEPGLMYEYSRDNMIGEVNSALVGTWLYDNYTNWSVTFNDDGTGRRGHPGDLHSFVWGTFGDVVNIRRVGYVPHSYARNELWHIIATCDTIRIECLRTDDVVQYYTRLGVLGEVNRALVGTWAWEDGIQWTWHFNVDGTGTVGWPGDTTRFNWGTDGNVLRIDLVGGLPANRFRHERWTFTIEGTILRLQSLLCDTEAVYIRGRGIGAVTPVLVGTWLWETNFGWKYTFNEDGTGIYGWYYYEPIEFIWGVIGNTLRILDWSGSIYSWNFYIYENYLRLESRRNYYVYYYIRDEFDEDSQDISPIL